MAEPKINDRDMLRLIDKEGLSQSTTAKKLGVTRQAVSRRLKELRGKTTRAVITKKVEQVIDNRLDAMAQLSQINGHAHELLDLLMGWSRGDPQALQTLEKQVKRIRIGEDEEVEVVQAKFKDPRDLAVKVMAEIRGQLDLQLKMFQTMYDMQAASEFQETVLEVIAEIDPEVRNEIIRRLNERRSVRSALRFT